MERNLMGINRVQILIGLMSLFVGCTIYVVRSPSRFYIAPESLSSLSALRDCQTLAFVVNSLPDLIHPFAFILMTSGIISGDRRTNQIVICCIWLTIEVFFEFGQYFKEIYSNTLFQIGSGTFIEDVCKFFINGTFDPVDLFLMCLGTIAAYFALQATSERRMN